ncbi:MAG: hypothetical protein ISR64_06825 [Deltaproteobacteria bacterium]|nr:hypothetical protein [Deltaproteobacteria bacterium]
MAKTRVNLSLDADLADFIKVFARENRTTVADVVTQYLLALKRRQAGDTTEMILANPAFRDALFDVQARMRDGKAQWHSFDEVFS